MTDSNAPMNKYVIEQMIKGLEESRAAISALKDQVSVLSVNIGVNNQKLADLEKDMGKDVRCLLKIIRDGNGQKPLLYRMSEAENKQKVIEDVIGKQEANKKEILQGKWQLRIAFIAGSFGLLTSIATAIIALFGG